MSELPKIDVTDYLYQKLSYCIVFDVDIKAKLEQFSYYLEVPHFWEVFLQELSFLLSRHCLLDAEVNRIYYALNIARTLDLKSASLQIINECMIRLNGYKIDMDSKYDDGFYIIEMKKRFPYEKFRPSAVEQYVPSIQGSLGMDFYLLWSLILDEEDLFQNKLLPNFVIEFPFISNIRAFAYEMPELFTTEVVCCRLEMLIEKYEEDLKEYNWLGRFRGKQLIKRYREYLK